MTEHGWESHYWTRYQEGHEQGLEDGYVQGYEDGYADAMASQPDPWAECETDEEVRRCGLTMLVGGGSET